MLTIGADPEFFVQTRDNKLKPICGLLGGTKEEPKPMQRDDGSPAKKGYAVQEDNVMVEFNIPPARNSIEFIDSIHAAKTYLFDNHLRPLNLLPYKKCSVQFPLEELQSEQAQLFGCAPDFDAYTNGEPTERVDPKTLVDGDRAWRFAGGHIHLGYKLKIPEFVVANFADVFLGLAAVSLGEKQGRRRELYGQAGRYRPTPYGIEYRTLSNFWLWNDNSAYRLSRAVESMHRYMAEKTEGELQAAFAEIPWPDVQNIINTENRPLANQLIEHLQQGVLQ